MLEVERSGRHGFIFQSCVVAMCNKVHINQAFVEAVNSSVRCSPTQSSEKRTRLEKKQKRSERIADIYQKWYHL